MKFNEKYTFFNNRNKVVQDAFHGPGAGPGGKPPGCCLASA